MVINQPTSLDKQYKVSFCITCKGRLDHLKQTLPENLRRNADYANAEFVVLDYDSRDGLEPWMKEHYQKEIATGRIRYAKFEPAPTFHMAHAKNIAHRLATGDIVCNLDADNVTAPGYAAWLNRQFSKDPDIYIRPHRKELIIKQLARDPMRGISGRIAIMRDRFMQLHGYDERYEGWGSDDKNFDTRAHLAGLKRMDVPYTLLGSVINHSDDMRTENYQGEVRQKTEEHLKRLEGLGGIALRLRHLNSREKEAQPPANPNGHFGCGQVRINFSEEPVTIEPAQQLQRLDFSPASPASSYAR